MASVANRQEIASSTAVSAPPGRTSDWRALRLGFGITIAFLLAMAFDWTLAYLLPSFTLPLLQGRGVPPLPAVVRVLLVTLVIMLACYLLAGVARIFPWVFLVSLFPALFWVFRYKLRGGETLVVLLLLVGLMLLPTAAKESPQVSGEFAASFVINIALAFTVAAIMFTLFPARPGEPPPKPKPALPAAEADHRAWLMTLITGLFAVVYFSFDWANVHTPLYIAIYIQQLSMAGSLGYARAILGANIAAGLLVVALYTLLVMAPNFAFMAALSLTVILVLARMLMSDAPSAPLAGVALSSTMILLGSAMTSLGNDGGDMFIDRMGELGAAALYAVAALYVFEALSPGKSR